MNTQSTHDPNVPDPENPEWTDAMLTHAKRLSDLPANLQRKLRTPGRPKAEVTKERISIRLSPDVVKAFRAGGPGWKTRIDAELRDWLKKHPAA
jgi:uncharacterized protein (DUF4415 family)